MGRFTYQAYTRDGQPVSGNVTATDSSAAVLHLRGQGLIATDIRAAGAEHADKWWNRELTGGATRGRKSVAAFTRDLGVLIGAALPVDEALQIIALQPTIDKRMRGIAKRMHADVTEGASLADAMQRHGNVFPAYLPRLVRAGEASGALAASLQDVGGFLERMQQTRERIVSALLYPAILTVAAAVAIAVVVTVLLPAIVPLIKSAGVPLPPLLAWFDWMSEGVTAYGPPVAASAVVVTIVVLIARAFVPSVRLALSRALIAIPFIGRLARQAAMMRYARTLGVLLRNGVAMLPALKNAAATAGHAAMERDFSGVETSVGEGRSLTLALGEARDVDDLLVRLAAVGEQTGDLPTMLDRAATIYQVSVERQLERAATLMTPVLTIVIGLVVGALVLSVLSAMTAINQMALS